MAQDKPNLPEATWAITADDKVKIQELGRKLVEFLGKEFAGKDRVPLKIVVGGFQYVMGLQEQKVKLIGDDYLLPTVAVNMAKLNEHIEEPFAPAPETPEPTIEERRAYLKGELEKLDIEESGQETIEASPAPTADAEPMPTPEPAPASAPTAAAVPEKPAKPAA